MRHGSLLLACDGQGDGADARACVRACGFPLACCRRGTVWPRLLGVICLRWIGVIRVLHSGCKGRAGFSVSVRRLTLTSVWQHVKVNMMACEAENCTHRFCTYCLTVHLGVDTDQKEAGVWHCPTCSGNCCCSGPECNKPHRHCKAFRYRQRRAAAATLRVSAANALVSLGFTLPAGKGKNKLVPTFDSGAHDHDKAERPAKRRESPLPGGPSEGGDESEDRLPRIGGTCEDQERAANQGEFESGESAVNLLASLGSGRSPSPTVNTQTDSSLTDGDRMKNDDAQIVNTDPAPGGSALEQLALLASHLAAVEPNGARSPPLASAPQVWRARSEDSLSAMSTLDTPRQSSEVETPVKVVSNSKMDIGELMTSPSSWVAKAPSLVSVVSLAQTAAPSPPTLSE